MADIQDIDGVLSRLEEIESLAPKELIKDGVALAKEQLGLGELILRIWVIAHDQVPTEKQKEGFVLLALHAQGTKGIPSFNACRETCREIVFHHNVIIAAGNDEARLKAIGLMIMVVRHLALFVSGKLAVAGLGEFCCAAKPLRQGDMLLASSGG